MPTTDEGIEDIAHLVRYCLGVPELVAEFNRLTGCTLGKQRTVMERLVDDATGYTAEWQRREDEQLRQFTAFVVQCVLLPLAVA